jgi:RNA polymerase sigma factor (TIGR02999 family)
MNSARPAPLPFADEQLLVESYGEMRRLARRHLFQMGSQSIQATELVNETYLRLVGRGRTWIDRNQLFGLAARSMRDILVERARSKASKKRGGGWRRVDWESAPQVAEEYPEELLMLDDALSRLSRCEPKSAQVVELMFFAGFTSDETAKALDVSPSTIDRRWRFARAWLHKELVAD